jgi:rhamnogalacturonan endolyase
MEGMQVFMVSEPKKEDGRGVSVVDAATGKLIWKIGQTTYHVGDGMVADFDSSHSGMECFASEDRKGGSTDKYLLTADGKKINTTNAEVPGCRNWIWWDADLLRETFKGDDNRWELLHLPVGANKASGNGREKC